MPITSTKSSELIPLVLHSQTTHPQWPPLATTLAFAERHTPSMTTAPLALPTKESPFGHSNNKAFVQRSYTYSLLTLHHASKSTPTMDYKTSNNMCATSPNSSQTSVIPLKLNRYAYRTIAIVASWNSQSSQELLIGRAPLSPTTPMSSQQHSDLSAKNVGFKVTQCGTAPNTSVSAATPRHLATPMVNVPDPVNNQMLYHS